MTQVFPTIWIGAIYIHQGITYIVEETNVDRRYAKIRMLNNINWTTQQRDYTYEEKQSILRLYAILYEPNKHFDSLETLMQSRRSVLAM